MNRDIAFLGTCNQTPEKGITRLDFTEADLRARAYLAEQMRAAGLEVCAHPSGNLIGTLRGRSPQKKPVMSGSHFDTVRNGGKYDGVCGIVCALEVARSWQEEGYVPDRSLQVIAFWGEEGARFHTGLLGSQLFVGAFTPADVKRVTDDEGQRLADNMDAAGIPWRFCKERALQPGDLAAFIELHIEQGPILERERLPIGIVTDIVSMNFGEITIFGRADHAGTTSMEDRADAMRAASEFFNEFYKIPDIIGGETRVTIGRISALPGSANVVPEQIRFSVDFRTREHKDCERICGMIEDGLRRIESERGVRCVLVMNSSSPPVQMDERLKQCIRTSLKRLNLRGKEMISGAGHDTMEMSGICPTAMIFIPSRNGRSHCEEEFTAPEEIARGAEVLNETLKQLCEGEEIHEI